MTSPLRNKRIVLGVTGGIAAYKSAELIRLLKKAGAHVQVMMSAGAQAFITPLTLQTLSENPVQQAVFQSHSSSTMAHIDLARWADLIVIAPATAHFLAKLTAGLADDALTTTCLATTARIMLAPAMNGQMWQNAATQSNIAVLRERSIIVIGPDDGVQACGEIGEGRMLEPEAIVANINDFFVPNQRLIGKTILLTAGPTQEALDPVRYLSNHSSGKMGYALAEAAHDQGAQVILISGPTALMCSKEIRRVDVVSAQQMLDAVMQQVSDVDIFIAAAAVADYRVASILPHKIKKSTTNLSLELIRNPDILAEVANLSSRPWVVGFAAETENLIDNARQKLIDKKLDMIIANEVGVHKGFTMDKNACTVLTADKTMAFPCVCKRQLATSLIDLIIDHGLASNKKVHLN